MTRAESGQSLPRCHRPFLYHRGEGLGPPLSLLQHGRTTSLARTHFNGRKHSIQGFSVEGADAAGQGL